MSYSFTFDNLPECYSEYLKEAAELQAKASPLEGVFGLNSPSQSNPLHMAFFKEVGRLTEAIAKDPGDTDVPAMMRLILFTAAEHPKTLAYWYLFAAQQQCMPLIPLLSQEEAQAILAEFEKTYKKREWLPVQKTLHKALKKQAAR